MNLIQRIVKYVTPPCGHEEELHTLRNQLQHAMIQHGLDARARQVIERARKRAADELEVLRKEHVSLEADHAETLLLFHSLERLIFEQHPKDLEYVDAESSLRLQRQRASDALFDATAALEETTGRIAILEQELREAKAAGFRAQTSFATQAPPAEEALPIPDDEIVSDNTIQLAYRLVGIFFEGRQHWLLARGEERIKVPIHDANWLEQMRRGEVQFRAGDTLLADFRVVTYRGGTGDVWAEHTVERVIRVIHADEQIEMPLAGLSEVANA